MVRGCRLCCVNTDHLPTMFVASRWQQASKCRSIHVNTDNISLLHLPRPPANISCRASNDQPSKFCHREQIMRTAERGSQQLHLAAASRSPLDNCIFAIWLSFHVCRALCPRSTSSKSGSCRLSVGVTERPSSCVDWSGLTSFCEK